MINKPVVLYGGYGSGNVGDYVTLAVALHDMAAHPRIILDIQGQQTERLFPDQTVLMFHEALTDETPMWKQRLHRKWWRYQLGKAFRAKRLPVLDRFPSWVRVLSQAECLYMVGGGYLNDIYSLPFFIQPAQVARAMGIPIRTAPLGIGPFHNESSRRLMYRTFCDSELRVRDEGSLRQAHLCGLSRVTLCPDDGVRWPETVGKHLLPEVPQTTSNGVPTIGVCAFVEPPDESPEAAPFADWWVAVLHALHQQEKAGLIHLKAFSFDLRREKETAFMTACLPGIQVVEPHRGSYLPPIEALRSCDGVIGSRFHAIVLSKAYGIPCWAVASSAYYQSKLFPLQDDVACQVIRFQDITPQTWVADTFPGKQPGRASLLSCESGSHLKALTIS